jgi:porin
MVPRSCSFSLFWVMWAGLLSAFMLTAAMAEDLPSGSKANTQGSLMSDAPEDTSNFLSVIEERGAHKESVFEVSPLLGLHEATDKAKQDLYEATHIKLGLSIAHLSQWLSESPLGGDTRGAATVLDLPATWELIDRGKPTQGQLFFHLQGRWNYGTTGPENLGPDSLGSLNGTANTYSAYTPAFIMRNLYWQQGGTEAGWGYRVGKLTPDAMFSTSAHISPQATFLPTTAIGSFANAYPDSGLGVAGALYFNDRVKLLGLVSNANSDRTDFGSTGQGDFYKALELGVKIAPRTPKAGYSKATLWHTDGTKNGLSSNGNLGPDGWGFFLKHEQELTADGRAIAIVKYGKSFNDAAFYEQQAGGHFLLYDPSGATLLENDLAGVGYTWANSALASATRSESNAEVFYRFPIFPLVDMTLSYQSVFNPALDPDNDHASVFSVRIRTTF